MELHNQPYHLEAHIDDFTAIPAVKGGGPVLPNFEIGYWHTAKNMENRYFWSILAASVPGYHLIMCIQVLVGDPMLGLRLFRLDWPALALFALI